jgi:hypothetical protein
MTFPYIDLVTESPVTPHLASVLVAAAITHYSNAGKPENVDAIEVNPCQEIDGVVTNIGGESGDTQNPAQPVFWSVYTHLTKGGVECIADFPTQRGAEYFAELLSEEWGIEWSVFPLSDASQPTMSSHDALPVELPEEIILQRIAAAHTAIAVYQRSVEQTVGSVFGEARLVHRETAMRQALAAADQVVIDAAALYDMSALSVARNHVIMRRDLDLLVDVLLDVVL